MAVKHRADVDNSFIRRFLLIALACFGFMIWGLYDRFYTGPIEIERAIAFKKLAADLDEGLISEDQRTEKWESICETNNWSTSKPKSPKVAEGYLVFQYFVIGIGLIGGILFLLHYLRLKGSWVGADEEGVEASWGQTLKFKDITGINKAKWAKKGIAKVSYNNEAGATKTMIFDDFKYHRETMGSILKMAEEHLSDEQIVGDQRESAKAEQPAGTQE